MNRIAPAVVASVLYLSAACMAADIWPQWRGPNRDCQISVRPWPEALQGHLTEAYRVPLGDGYSGPIVSEDRVYVTESVEGNEVVRAIDRQSGSVAWSSQWSASMTVPFFAAANGSWIRSTPVLAQGVLIVASMEDVLICLDAADGTEKWKKDFRSEFGTSNQSFGFVCSPLVWNEFVFVQTGAGLVKLSLETGKTEWRSLPEEGGMMGGAFSSPVVATIHDLEQLVVQTRSKLAGVSLQTGEELWSVDVPAFRGMNILTPTVVGSHVFTSSYGGGSFLFEITRNTDQDWQIEETWKSKVEAYMSSPVVLDKHIYVHLRNQRFTCLDLSDGESEWTSTPFGKYWSMVVNGERSLVLDERGDLILLELTPTSFVKLDSYHLTDSSAWAHIAVADNQVFVREQNALVALDWK